MKQWSLSVVLTFIVFFSVGYAQSDEVYSGHAIALHGDIKYGPDFEHFDYVQPDAPKGGDVILAAIGSYDSFNSFINEGVSAVSLGLLYDTLTTQSLDEAFTEYGLLAETIEVPADKSYVQYRLRDNAYWHDGTPITADDVIYSFETLTEVSTGLRSYYESVSGVEKIDDLTVKFSFGDETNNELPLIMGQLTIIPKHYWENLDITKTTLDPPLGSGPYRIADFDAGRSIRYERVADYWAQDLAVNKGQHNFNTITYEYFLDTTVAIEAFKAGEYDYRVENVAKEWATSYNLAAVDEGHLVKVFLPNENPQGMQAFYINNRQAKFADPRVREALGYAFDFEWTNENLFYGQYTRTDSFFENSELASSGIPEGLELEILEPYRDQLPAELFSQPFSTPQSDGSGSDRASLAKAVALLAEAGWEVQDGQLTNTETGELMKLEFLLRSATFERVVAPFIQNLERLGIDASQRTVDSSQWLNRVLEFDYDVIIITRRQSLSPGNEQRNYWTTEAADVSGSWNLAGIKNATVDALVEEVIAAPDRETLVAATRALDRVLLWGHYVIPQWHIAGDRILYWNKFSRPEIAPVKSVGFPSTWWLDSDKLSTLKQGQ